MKHSTTYRHLVRLLSLTLWAALTAACSNDDNIAGNPSEPANARGIPFTATIIMGGESPTRALSNPGSGTTINATWATGEHVALVYKVGDVTIVTDAEVTAVSDGTYGKTAGTATIEALIDKNVIDGTDVTLIYPYSAVYTTGKNIGKIKDDLFTSQRGVLRNSESGSDISKKYDLRQGDGKIYRNGTDDASLKSDVTMVSQVCIWKMSLVFDDLEAHTSEFQVPAGKFITILFGDRAYTIESELGGVSGGGPTTYRAFQTGDVIYVAMLPDDAKEFRIVSTKDDSYSFDYSKTNVSLTAGKYYQSTVTMTKGSGIKSVTAPTGLMALEDGDIVTGTGGTATHITIANNATVTLANLTNTSIGHAFATAFAGIECLGNAHIILVGSNSVEGVGGHAGISVPSGKTLTISGSGSLTATGGDFAAGIGGNQEESCGHINITGGTVTATGGSKAAGIGSGSDRSFGTISISGSAHVTATGGSEAAGIGSGHAYNVANTSGAITISGSAHVTATGGNYAAGIGSGYAGNATNACGSITIEGSVNVMATGGDLAAGIGSGHAHNAANTSGAITIKGSAHVTATGGEFATGIGSGNGNENSGNPIVSSCDAISITGGTVSATSGEDAAGIGSGCFGKFASINITSGITSVTATRSNNYFNVPIGKGYNDQGSGSISIDGEAISDDMTKGTATLPTFPNLQVVKTDTPVTNVTWTITKK